MKEVEQLKFERDDSSAKKKSVIPKKETSNIVKNLKYNKGKKAKGTPKDDIEVDNFDFEALVDSRIHEDTNYAKVFNAGKALNRTNNNKKNVIGNLENNVDLLKMDNELEEGLNQLKFSDRLESNEININDMNGKPWFETKVIEDNKDCSNNKENKSGVFTIIKKDDDTTKYIPTKNKKQKMI